MISLLISKIYARKMNRADMSKPMFDIWAYKLQGPVGNFMDCV